MPLFSDVASDVEGGEIILILLLVAGIGYAIYYVASNGLSALTSNFGGADTADDEGNYGSGLAGTVLNDTLSVGSGPISYTQAATQTLLHPIDTLKAIWGE